MNPPIPAIAPVASFGSMPPGVSAAAVSAATAPVVAGITWLATVRAIAPSLLGSSGSSSNESTLPSLSASKRTTLPSLFLPMAKPTPVFLSVPEDTVSMPSLCASFTAGIAGVSIMPSTNACAVGLYPSAIVPSGLRIAPIASKALPASMDACCGVAPACS